MSVSAPFTNNTNKSNNILNTKIMNDNVNNIPAYSTTIGGSDAVKILSYKNIAPAPPPPTATATSVTEYKPIAPATVVDVGVKSRKYTPRVTNTPPAAPYGGGDQTVSVQRRNARERNRVKQVNNSFARLRQHLPQYIVSDMTKGGGRGPHKKISKVDTLRIAVEYIRRLEYLVEDLGGTDCLGTEESTNNIISTAISTAISTSNGKTTAPAMHTTQIYYTTTNATATSSPQPLEYHQQQQQILSLQPATTQVLPQPQQHCYSSTLLTPVSLAAFSPIQTRIDMSCHSPTASYISNASFDSGTYEPAQQLSPESSFNDIAASDLEARKNNANLALKFEPYDTNFRLDEEDCTPDDDDIIDYISLWQEEQQATQNLK